MEPRGPRAVADEDRQSGRCSPVEERGNTAAASPTMSASGASNSSSRVKSPPRAAAMKESTISHRAKWSVGVGWPVLLRAREASLRAVTLVVSSTWAMVSKSKPKLSCSTKATRSLGVSRSSRTCSAMPTASANARSSAGSGATPGTSMAAWGWGCERAVGPGTAVRSRSSARRGGSRSRQSNDGVGSMPAAPRPRPRLGRQASVMRAAAAAGAAR